MKKKKPSVPKLRIPIYKIKPEQTHKTDKVYDKRIRRREKQEIKKLLKNQGVD